MRGMKVGLARGVVLIGALLLGAGSALAAEVTAVVVVPDQTVTVSFGTSKPVATYKVRVQNISSSSATQNTRFLATTSVAGSSDPAVTAPFSEPANPDPASYTCTATTFARTTIDCFIGVLQPGEWSREFTITVVAPTSGTSVGLHWEAIFNNGTSPGLSNGDAGDTGPLALAQLDPDTVKTYVPVNTSLLFFTNTGIATKDDPWATRVSIPGGQAETLATVLEQKDQVDCARAADLTACYSTKLTIPLPSGVTYGVPGTAGTLGLAQFLKITLLRDASTIVKGAKISSAVVYYQKDETSPKQVVPSCASNPSLPQPGQPCEDLTQRKEFPRKNSARTPVEPGFESDWQFVIYATDNGRYDN